MPLIRVLFGTITSDQYNQVIEYYNTHKQNDMKPIYRLQRAEGGFAYNITDDYEYDPNCSMCKNWYVTCNINRHMCQLRWTNRWLKPGEHIGFGNNETKLLYKSLMHVFGEDQVELESFR